MSSCRISRSGTGCGAKWRRDTNAMLAKRRELIVPYHPEWASCVWHLYVVRVSDREGLKKSLAGAGVDTAIHYPIPLHLQSAYRRLTIPKAAFRSRKRFPLTFYPCRCTPA